MIKKKYMKPTMLTVKLKQRSNILVGSLDSNGMNKSLQNEEVDKAW
ncbi:MAG: hypothetical protein K5896_11545 [Prevotella sp.]|nr:hypothetical protein [Prevotella sp.]